MRVVQGDIFFPLERRGLHNINSNVGHTMDDGCGEQQDIIDESDDDDDFDDDDDSEDEDDSDDEDDYENSSKNPSDGI